MSEQWHALSADEASAGATWLYRRCKEVVAEAVADMPVDPDDADDDAAGQLAEEMVVEALFAVASLGLGVPADQLDPAALVMGALVPGVEGLVEQALTVPGHEPGTTGQVGTLFGLAQVAQGGLAAHTDRMLDAFTKSGLQPGQSGGWFCPMCQTPYPDDFEPDFCPPCGSRLMRLRAPTTEEREAWEREHPKEGQA